MGHFGLPKILFYFSNIWLHDFSKILQVKDYIITIKNDFKFIKLKFFILKKGKKKG